jgi:toxin CcdB
MARFDVYRDADDLLVLDVQADTLPHLRTRLVVPLFDMDDAPRPLIDTLNPVFTLSGGPVAMMTQYAAAVPQSHLGTAIGTLADEDYRVGRALDLLLTGI